MPHRHQECIDLSWTPKEGLRIGLFQKNSLEVKGKNISQSLLGTLAWAIPPLATRRSLGARFSLCLWVGLCFGCSTLRWRSLLRLWQDRPGKGEQTTLDWREASTSPHHKRKQWRTTKREPSWPHPTFEGQGRHSPWQHVFGFFTIERGSPKHSPKNRT